MKEQHLHAAPVDTVQFSDFHSHCHPDSGAGIRYGQRSGDLSGRDRNHPWRGNPREYAPRIYTATAIGINDFDPIIAVQTLNGEFDPNADPDLSFLSFAMTSYERQSIGDYVVVFHVGAGAGPDTQSNI